ncbi:MAG: protein of unknown function with transrane region [Parcubacteria group bacterium]|nr:protein of unknown function with transrane region [Parcubacteria group bacterium]
MPLSKTMKKNLAASLLLIGLLSFVPHISFAQKVITDDGAIKNSVNTDGTIKNNPTTDGTIKNNPTDDGAISNSDGKGLVNPLKNISSLDGLLSAVLNAIVTVLAPIFLTLAFIYVGFLFVMARGNAEKISSARSALVWTVIGALILLGANAIGLVIKSTVSGL